MDILPQFKFKIKESIFQSQSYLKIKVRVTNQSIASIKHKSKRLTLKNNEIYNNISIKTSKYKGQYIDEHLKLDKRLKL